MFSLRTRKMKDDGQDDSKFIAASVYVMNVVSVVIIVSNISLVGFLNTRLVVLCLFHLFGNIAVLCLVFIPKVSLSVSSFSVTLALCSKTVK